MNEEDKTHFIKVMLEILISCIAVALLIVFVLTGDEEMALMSFMLSLVVLSIHYLIY